jgi:hypothetical protein
MKKTIKKVRKYGEGGDVPCPPGGGGKCRPMGSIRSGSYKSESYKPGKVPRMSKKEEAEADKTYRINMMLKTSGKRTEPQSTAPGVRDMKKGSQEFFGRNRYEDEAKHGKKVVKKAKVGKKIVKKSIKKK